MTDDELDLLERIVAALAEDPDGYQIDEEDEPAALLLSDRGYIAIEETDEWGQVAVLKSAGEEAYERAFEQACSPRPPAREWQRWMGSRIVEFTDYRFDFDYDRFERWRDFSVIIGNREGKRLNRDEGCFAVIRRPVPTELALEKLLRLETELGGLLVWGNQYRTLELLPDLMDRCRVDPDTELEDYSFWLVGWALHEGHSLVKIRVNSTGPEYVWAVWSDPPGRAQ